MRIAPTPARIASTTMFGDHCLERIPTLRVPLLLKTRCIFRAPNPANKSEVPHYNVALVERSKFGRKKRMTPIPLCGSTRGMNHYLLGETSHPQIRKLPPLCLARLKMFLGSTRDSSISRVILLLAGGFVSAVQVGSNKAIPAAPAESLESSRGRGDSK